MNERDKSRAHAEAASHRVPKHQPTNPTCDMRKCDEPAAHRDEFGFLCVDCARDWGATSQSLES